MSSGVSWAAPEQLSNKYPVTQPLGFTGSGVTTYAPPSESYPLRQDWVQRSDSQTPQRRPEQGLYDLDGLMAAYAGHSQQSTAEAKAATWEQSRQHGAATTLDTAGPVTAGYTELVKGSLAQPYDALAAAYDKTDNNAHATRKVAQDAHSPRPGQVSMTQHVAQADATARNLPIGALRQPLGADTVHRSETFKRTASATSATHTGKRVRAEPVDDPQHNPFNSTHLGIARPSKRQATMSGVGSYAVKSTTAIAAFH